MIKAIIFDLDGTLADTMPDLQTAMNNMLVRLGYRTRTRTELISAINKGAREFVRRSLPKDVSDVEFILDSALETYTDEYSRCYCDNTAAFTGIEAVLMELKSQGIKLAVLSNKQDKFVKDIISKLFDKKLFSCVMGQGSYPTKPNPASALAIAKELGVKPYRTLFVGDSDVDMQTAKNAGMRSMGVSWGYREAEVLREAGATYIVRDPQAIPVIVANLKDEDEKPLKAKKKEVAQ
jgi:phosphoglycolate phosphatase